MLQFFRSDFQNVRFRSSRQIFQRILAHLNTKHMEFVEKYFLAFVEGFRLAGGRFSIFFITFQVISDRLRGLVKMHTTWSKLTELLHSLLGVLCSNEPKFTEKSFDLIENEHFENHF